MGFFSFILQDTGEAIPNHHLREAKEFGDFHIHGPNGVCFSSNGYDGYGDFYGEVGDIFFFTYSLNRKRKINPCDDLRWEKARAIGHRIFHNPRKGEVVPNITRFKDWVWRNEAPQDDPLQGFFAPVDEDENDEGDGND